MPPFLRPKILDKMDPKPQGMVKNPDIMDQLLQPMVNAPAYYGKVLADKIDQPSVNRSPFQAKLMGLLAGMTEGAGNVASEMTSPANLAMLSTGSRIPGLLAMAGGVDKMRKSNKPLGLSQIAAGMASGLR